MKAWRNETVLPSARMAEPEGDLRAAALEILVQATAGGRPVAQAAAHALALATGYRWGGVIRLLDDGCRGILLGFWDMQGDEATAHRQEGHILSMPGTPCNDLREQARLLFVPSGVTQRFPKAGAGLGLKPSRYQGQAYGDPSGAVHGQIFVMDAEPDDGAGPHPELFDLVAQWLSRELNNENLTDALIESERRFSAMLANLPGTVFQQQLGEDGEVAFSFMSRGLADTLGMAPEDVFGSDFVFLDHIHPDDQEGCREALFKAMRTLSPCEIEFRLRDPQGRIHWMQSWSRPRRQEDGCVIWDGYMVDISALKQKEEALRLSRNRLDAILASALDGIVTIDEKGIIRSSNPALEQIFGYGSEEILGQPVAILMPPEEAVLHQHHLRRYMQTGVGSIIGVGREVMGRRRDGTEFPLELAVTEVPIGDERWFLGVLRDITGRKQAEAALRDALREAQLANRAKTEFLANISHELRTPLNAVIGFSELIQGEVLGPLGNERYRGYIDDIHDSAAKLLTILNDILDLSQLRTEHYKLRRQTIDLGELAQAVLAQAGGLAERADVTLINKAEERPLKIEADPRALRQILWHLVANGIKFNFKGGSVTFDYHLTGHKAEAEAEAEAVVGVGAEAGTDQVASPPPDLALSRQTASQAPLDRMNGKAFLDIRITDTGIGIDPADIPKALDPFTQVDGALERRYEGAGLGLPLTKALVELHGGKLLIDSQPGSGTTITLRLPAERVIAGATDS